MASAQENSLNMRILLVTGSFPPMRCGVGDYSFKLAKALSAEPGMQVGVLTSTLANSDNQNNGVVIFPAIKKWSLFEVFQAVKIAKCWSPDIVHIQYPTQGYGNGWLPWILPVIFFLMGSRIVQTWHGGDGRRDLLKFCLKLIVPAQLVVVHASYEDNFHPMMLWAVLRKNPVFIPNASAIPRVEPDPQSRDLIKKQYLKEQKRLIVFFGFVMAHKGVELLFEIANPAVDQIVIAGEIVEDSEYCQEILRRASADVWREKVTITGFLPAADAAELLAVADAVILPFRIGGGEWNTSIHGAVLNGAFVITTSLTRNGYDKKRNVYYAKVDDIQEMKSALSIYGGMQMEFDAEIHGDEWGGIAKKHKSLYENVLTTCAS